MNRYGFQVEKNFTDVYRQYHDAHAALREIKCLETMYPAILCPIKAGDLFAGRINMSLIGFSPEPGGLGYYCQTQEIRQLLDSGEYSVSERAEIEAMLGFWETENTSFRVRAAYPPEVAEALPSDEWKEVPMPAAPLYRMAGIYLDYEKLLNLGIPGLIALVEEKRGLSQNADEAALFDAMVAALGLLSKCCLYYARQARELAAETNDTEYSGIASVLEHISCRRPETLRQAMQLMWLYTIISGSINYGRLDVALGDFYAADIADGTLSPDEAQRLFNGLWQLMADRKTTWNGRVIFGGVGRHNVKNADEVALMAMEATRVVKEIEPQLSLRIYDGMDPRLMDKALEVIGEGRTYPMLYNDDVNVPAVMNAFRLGREEAEDYVPFGCGEYVVNHRSFGTPNGIINLLKVLELTLRNGRDGLTGQQAGLKTGEFADFSDFESLWQAYARQAEYFVHALAKQEVIEYGVVGNTAPFLFLSMLYDDCIERGKGIFSGGIRYLGGTIETYGNINTADSLNAIREIVYERRLITPAELLKALDADFKGYELLRKQLQELPKYGNDDAAADGMAVRVHEHICNTVRDSARQVGLHSYLVVIINNDANTTWGRRTCASADGRCRGQYMANANNPFSGSDKKGLTAMLNSLVKLRPDIHAGAVQNMKFSPELFQNGCAVIKSVLQSYFEKGGTQAMISVVKREDLEQALLHPENYGHLFVRVGGFSARYIELAPDVQLEILNRTLY